MDEISTQSTQKITYKLSKPKPISPQEYPFGYPQKSILKWKPKINFLNINMIFLLNNQWVNENMKKS